MMMMLLSYYFYSNSDNEPFLLFAAAAWGYLTGGNPAAYASQLLYAAVASRYV